MKKEEIEKIVKNLMEAKRSLEEINETPFESVNTNVKKALISVYQALYQLGEEER